ncbi:hypothetical protein CONLIGDRAFT_274445 [Coniochaeta ligniaria NRRL 30616]|uniref:Uncharacterized protein n=1 Tax=Coniochaeta ligniaria NRRL 30616 TaxID=1408157 RepID=A0A1J7JRH8_9PEZI|nr:hypothetical protein CONLIGDRAFT_274445 [Coniochaeta ligniaria NRRL 30616]
MIRYMPGMLDDAAAMPALNQVPPPPAAAPGLPRNPPKPAAYHGRVQRAPPGDFRFGQLELGPLQPPAQPDAQRNLEMEHLAHRLANRRNVAVHNVAKAVPQQAAAPPQPAPAQVPKAQYKQHRKDAAKRASPAGAGYQQQRAAPPRSAHDENVRQLKLLEEANKRRLAELKRRHGEDDHKQRLEHVKRQQQVVQNARRAANDAHVENIRNAMAQQAAARRQNAVIQVVQGQLQAAQAQKQAVAAYNVRPHGAGNVAVPPAPQQAGSAPRPLRVQHHPRHQHVPPPVLAYGNRVAQLANRRANGGMLGGPARL